MGSINLVMALALNVNKLLGREAVGSVDKRTTGGCVRSTAAGERRAVDFVCNWG
jgi:hypothetical protein